MLCEALRKALYVTEFIIREKKNRKQIVDPADVIWFRILSLPLPLPPPSVSMSSDFLF